MKGDLGMNLDYVMFKEGPVTSPYSDMVVVDGRYLYLSGLISQDLDSSNVIYGSVTDETRLILNNLAKILKSYGSDMDHVIRADVVLADFSERDEMNAEYIRHFKSDHLPARLCTGNVKLHGNCKVEIAVIARIC